MDRARCIERLAGAVAWGLSSERPAWARTVERIEASAGSYRREDLERIRGERLLAVLAGLSEWFGPICARLEPGASVPDLEHELPDIWRGMVCMNQGIFAEPAGGSGALLPLLVTVPSVVIGQGPLYLSLNLDGWGIAPARTDAR
jgi:hypothetical protein